jgi:hypothetical protein
MTDKPKPRGRPRSANPLSPAERTAKWRERNLETGGRELRIALSAEDAAALDRLCEHYGEVDSVVVRRLINNAAKRI